MVATGKNRVCQLGLLVLVSVLGACSSSLSSSSKKLDGGRGLDTTARLDVAVGQDGVVSPDAVIPRGTRVDAPQRLDTTLLSDRTDSGSPTVVAGTCSATNPQGACPQGQYCANGKCTTPTTRSYPATCEDSFKSGDETGVNCGGSCPMKCSDGTECKVAADCVSGMCKGTCQLPTCTDGIKNGAEDGIDCGGKCTACAASTTQCNDGIDNDGDGLVDWQFDHGCTSKDDTTEGGLPGGAIENGWTVFEPSADTRIVYVSAAGNDSADGLTPTTARKTAAAGVKLLRNGYPDWLLFRRGDSFSGTFDISNLSGRSSSERLLIGAYGEGNRPAVRLGTLTMGPQHVAVTNLSFTISGVDSARGGNDLLFEGCSIAGGSFVVSEGTGPLRHGIALRRNTFTQVGSAIYVSAVAGFLIEENIIYKANVKEDGDHGMYINDKEGTEGVTTRGNLVYVGSRESDGIKQRSGGLCENNVVVSVEWSSIHFETYADRPSRYVTARNNLISERRASYSGGITVEDGPWAGTVTDTLVADDPSKIDSPPVSNSASRVTVTKSNQFKKPVDSEQPNMTILGAYNSEVFKGDATTTALFERIIQQSRFNYNPDLSADSIIAYARRRLGLEASP